MRFFFSRRAQLSNVLHAYSCHDFDIGYVFGVGSLAAVFLAHLNDEEVTVKTVSVPIETDEMCLLRFLLYLVSTR